MRRRTAAEPDQSQARLRVDRLPTCCTEPRLLALLRVQGRRARLRRRRDGLQKVWQSADTPGIWNPLPWFDTVKHDRQLKNIQPMDDFFHAAKRGKLASITWLVPNNRVSEHPPALISRGQTYVTSVINAIMRSPDWPSTAIILAWDDWGGFYDHVVPRRSTRTATGSACRRS